MFRDSKRKYSGMASLPYRFLTPFPHRSSRRLRNSLRSNILAAQQSWIPSRIDSGRLNLQRSLHPFPNILFYIPRYVLPKQNGREPLKLRLEVPGLFTSRGLEIATLRLQRRYYLFRHCCEERSKFLRFALNRSGNLMLLTKNYEIAKLCPR